MGTGCRHHDGGGSLSLSAGGYFSNHCSLHELTVHSLALTNDEYKAVVEHVHDVNRLRYLLHLKL